MILIPASALADAGKSFQKIMMKKLYFLVFILITDYAYSQGSLRLPISESGRYVYTRILPNYRIRDTSYINLAYEFQFITDTIKNQKWEDITILQVGKKYSKHFSGRGYMIDSLNTLKTILQHGNINFPQLWFVPESHNAATKYHTLRTEILYNKNKATFMVWQPEPMSYNSERGYVYRDAAPCPCWEIESNAKPKILLGYQCLKATTEFRGRKYSAWFTPEIPISQGPWKFRGLPGLILEISDSENKFYWNCISINLQCFPIVEFCYNYKPITRKQYNLFERRIHEDPKTLFEMRGINVYFYDQTDMYSPEEINWEIPYNPIERE